MDAGGRAAPGAAAEGTTYLLQHTLQLLHNIIVPEAQHRITLAAQPHIPMLVVVHLFRMLSTVNFDNQSPLHANKIYNVVAYWLLPFEFQTQETMRPQAIPQSSLGFGLFAA